MTAPQNEWNIHFVVKITFKNAFSSKGRKKKERKGSLQNSWLLTAIAVTWLYHSYNLVARHVCMYVSKYNILMYVLLCIQKLNSIQLHVRKSQQKLAILVCVRIGVYRDGGSISNLVKTYIKNTYLTFICCCTMILEGI